MDFWPRRVFYSFLDAGVFWSFGEWGKISHFIKKVIFGILVLNSQKEDLELVDRVVLVNQGKSVDFRLDKNGVLMFRDRVCVPYVLELKKRILEEGHMSSLSIHPGAMKMYQDLKRLFWWPGKKKDITEFMYAYLVCQKSKIEH